MTAVRFGTDGIRGIAGVSLTDSIAYALGAALAARYPGGRILIGRDTRPSGVPLSHALAHGITVGGAHAISLGIIPTPGLAALVAGEPQAACGVVVTASHNPVEYNGLKVLGRDGRKVPDTVERELETAINAELARALPVVIPPDSSANHEGDHYRARYAAQLAAIAANASPNRAAAGLRVLVDAANGAGAPFAQEALAATGAAVQGIAMGEGVINERVGATSPEALGERVERDGVDIGIALDGDADRCAVVDERGHLVDGDILIGLIALDRKARSLTNSDRVVATILTNSGIERRLAAAGIQLQRTPVGDRHIAEALAGSATGFGGEKSGHLLFSEHAPTGDGLISAIEVIALLARAKRPLSALAAELPLDPQLQRVIGVKEGEAERLLADSRFINVIREQEGNLVASGGRLLVRPSGTEPLLRVMGEGPDAAAVEAAVERVLSVAAHLLASPS